MFALAQTRALTQEFRLARTGRTCQVLRALMLVFVAVAVCALLVAGQSPWSRP